MSKMYIYKIENLINGKVYIGKSKDPEQRWKQHTAAAKAGSDLLLHRAIKKYGEDSFEMTVLSEHTASEINEAEMSAIKQYNCCVLNGSDNGYNMTYGGDGFDSESTSHYMNIITAEGRNPFSRGNPGSVIAAARAKEYGASPDHHFKTEEARKSASERQLAAVKAGTHKLTSEQSKEVQKRRIEEGTFHAFDPAYKDLYRKYANAAIEAGTHNFVIESTCPHCGKVGKGPSMKRWHFDNCKSKT